MKNFTLTLLLSSFAALTVNAQDRLSGQFFSAPLSYNPAATGLINDDMRLSASYENLITYYYDDYRTTDISYDMPIMKGVLPKGDAIGVGLGYHASSLRDTRPSNTQFDNNSLALSLAYHLGLGKSGNHHLSMGAQTIYTTYAHVFGPNGAPHHEEGNGRDINYNWGIMYSGALSARTSVYGGFARYFSGMLYSRDRYTGFVGITFTLGKQALLFTNITYSSGEDIQGSAYARFLLNSNHKSASKYNIAIYGGALLTLDKSFSPYIGFEVAHTRIGFSFDTRNLGDSKYPSGSYQLSLIYTGGLGKLLGKQKANTWHCPVMY